MNYLYIIISILAVIIASLFINLFRNPYLDSSKSFMDYLVIPEDPKLIYPPRIIFLSFIVAAWILMYILWLLTYNVLVLISVPMWALLLCIWNTFCKTWQAYGYSKIILNTATIIVNIILIILAELTRKGLAPYIF